MAEYTASRLSEGNKLFPPSVITESEGMKIKFPKLFGGEETFVSYDDISSISFDAPMIGFTQLHINIRGNVTTVEGFYKRDCQTIVNEWKKAKNIAKKQELKQNEKLKEKKRFLEKEDEKCGDITNMTTDKDQQQLSASQQMELEIKKLEVKKLQIEAKEKAKERARERADEVGEKVAGIASNVKEWLSNEDVESPEEKAEKLEKKEKLDEIRRFKLCSNDKDALINSLTSLSEYADKWAEESAPDEYLIVAKSNFDSGVAMLQALAPNDPMVAYFTQKQTLLEKRANKTKKEKLLFTIIGIIVFIGILVWLQMTEKK